MINFLFKGKEYLTLLTWEKWFLLFFLGLFGISILFAIAIRITAAFNLIKDQNLIDKFKRWSSFFTITTVIILVLSPTVFLIINFFGFVKGIILTLAISLFIVSLIIGTHYLKNKKNKLIRISSLIMLLISLIVISLIAGEKDYKYRKELKEKHLIP